MGKTIKHRYSELVYFYFENYSKYIPNGVSATTLRDEFNEYCRTLLKKDDKIVINYTELGVKYSKEKIEHYRTGNSEWYLNYILVNNYPFFDNEYSKEPKLLEFIESEESDKFYHDPGTTSEITLLAHDKWWQLQQDKHKLAHEYVENERRKTQGVKSKTHRAFILCKPIIKRLINGEINTETELVQAFKDVNMKYISEKPMLRPDGTAYESRVCQSCAQLFALKYHPDTIDWTAIKNKLKEKGLGIKQMK